MISVFVIDSLLFFLSYSIHEPKKQRMISPRESFVIIIASCVVGNHGAMEVLAYYCPGKEINEQVVDCALDVLGDQFNSTGGAFLNFRVRPDSLP